MAVGAVGAARWLPNYDEFFFSLGNLLNTCEQQLNSIPSDRSEFHFRRLDELHKKHSCCCTRSRTINDARIAKTTRIDGSESSCYALAASDSRENSLPSTLIPNSCRFVSMSCGKRQESLQYHSSEIRTLFAMFEAVAELQRPLAVLVSHTFLSGHFFCPLSD